MDINVIRERNREWIGCLRHACISESLHTGIYPSVTAGMAALESAYGMSSLAENHYNFFGMKINPRAIGKTITSWDGTKYTGHNCDDRRAFADYIQAGDYGSGFLMSLRHYGWNFWATREYRHAGVLNHVSSGLTAEEARNDAVHQMIELLPTYAPHTDIEGDFLYVRKVLDLIDKYGLWEYDKEFLERGGWDGTVPYSFR